MFVPAQYDVLTASSNPSRRRSAVSSPAVKRGQYRQRIGLLRLLLGEVLILALQRKPEHIVRLIGSSDHGVVCRRRQGAVLGVLKLVFGIAIGARADRDALPRQLILQVLLLLLELRREELCRGI